jgi:hypothetical protein
MNFNTFAELAFYFRITPGMLMAGIAFSALMGALGGFLPALLAARRTIIQSIRDWRKRGHSDFPDFRCEYEKHSYR